MSEVRSVEPAHGAAADGAGDAVAGARSGDAASELAFSDVFPIAELPPKPRTVGVTEIRARGLGSNHLHDLVEVWGDYIDSIKWPSASQRLVRREVLRTQHAFLRAHRIEVSTGGMIERVLPHGETAVRAYLEECRELGFTIVEVSSGNITLPLDHKLNLIRAVTALGLKAKPEVAMPKGERHRMNADRLLHECEAALEAGAWKVMIEEGGIFENVDEWRPDVIYRLTEKIHPKHLMFEASVPKAADWFIDNYGHEVNLFIDWSQVGIVAGHRAGLWGKHMLRVGSFRS